MTCQTTDQQPSAYIEEALSSAGISCTDIRILSYSPSAFGNLVAIAHTSIGLLNIVYDRGFSIDHPQEIVIDTAAIITALDCHKKMAKA